MSGTELPFPEGCVAPQCYSISVDEENVLPGALQLIRELRPEWDLQRIQTKMFTEGISNKLLACYVDPGMEDAVLVRVYGNMTELFVDRHNEVKSFQLLRQHGCAPDLYCTFQNGLCYEFMPGRALGPEEVREPRIFRLIAEEMAKYHSIPIPNGSHLKSNLCHKLRLLYAIVKMDILGDDNAANSRVQANVPAMEVLEQELTWMESYLPTLGSPIVLCHNDLLCKNVIYNETKGNSFLLGILGTNPSTVFHNCFQLLPVCRIKIQAVFEGEARGDFFEDLRVTVHSTTGHQWRPEALQQPSGPWCTDNGLTNAAYCRRRTAAHIYCKDAMWEAEAPD